MNEPSVTAVDEAAELSTTTGIYSAKAPATALMADSSPTPNVTCSAPCGVSTHEREPRNEATLPHHAVDARVAVGCVPSLQVARVRERVCALPSCMRSRLQLVAFADPHRRLEVLNSIADRKRVVAGAAVPVELFRRNGRHGESKLRDAAHGVSGHSLAAVSLGRRHGERGCREAEA